MTKHRFFNQSVGHYMIWQTKSLWCYNVNVMLCSLIYINCACFNWSINNYCSCFDCIIDCKLAFCQEPKSLYRITNCKWSLANKLSSIMNQINLLSNYLIAFNIYINVIHNHLVSYSVATNYAKSLIPAFVKFFC